MEGAFDGANYDVNVEVMSWQSFPETIIDSHAGRSISNGRSQRGAGEVVGQRAATAHNLETFSRSDSYYDW